MAAGVSGIAAWVWGSGRTTGGGQRRCKWAVAGLALASGWSELTWGGLAAPKCSSSYSRKKFITCLFSFFSSPTALIFSFDTWSLVE